MTAVKMSVLKLCSLSARGSPLWAKTTTLIRAVRTWSSCSSSFSSTWTTPTATSRTRCSVRTAHRLEWFSASTWMTVIPALTRRKINLFLLQQEVIQISVNGVALVCGRSAQPPRSSLQSTSFIRRFYTLSITRSSATGLQRVTSCRQPP